MEFKDFNTFAFTGKVGHNSEESKMPWLKSGTGKSGVEWESASLWVESAKGNRGYADIMGSKQDVIKTRDADWEPLEIKWEDRKDKEIVNKIPYSRHYVIQTGSDSDTRHDYITPYDLKRFIEKHIDEISGKNWYVKGNITKTTGKNGGSYTGFNITGLYAREDDCEKGLLMKATLYWDKDGIDTDEWKEKQKLTINGYISDYSSADKKRMAFPHQVVLDCSQYDLDDKDGRESVEYYLAHLGLSLKEDGKVKTSALKSGKYYANQLQFEYSNGIEEVPFDESELTAFQKKAIALGKKTIDDFKPKGNIYGSSKPCWRIVDGTFGKGYESGAVMLDVSADDFEECIVRPQETESLADAMNPPEDDDELPKPKPRKVEKKQMPEDDEDEDEDDDLINDLFGDDDDEDEDEDEEEEKPKKKAKKKTDDEEDDD